MPIQAAYTPLVPGVAFVVGALSGHVFPMFAPGTCVDARHLTAIYHEVRAASATTHRADCDRTRACEIVRDVASGALMHRRWTYPPCHS